jgi:hypothetical protein
MIYNPEFQYNGNILHVAYILHKLETAVSINPFCAAAKKGCTKDLIRAWQKKYARKA